MFHRQKVANDDTKNGTRKVDFDEFTENRRFFKYGILCGLRMEAVGYPTVSQVS